MIAVLDEDFRVNHIPDRLVFDIGANIGLHTLFFATSTLGRVQVHAFEPNRDNFALLKCSVKQNKLQNVKINNFGFGRVETSACMSTNAENQGGIEILPKSSSTAAQCNPNSPQHISIRRLDKYMQTKKPAISSPFLVKIDIEGHEMHALSPSLSYLSKAAPATPPPAHIFTEVSPTHLARQGSHGADVYLDFLWQLGYELRVAAGSHRDILGSRVVRTGQTYARLLSMDSNVHAYRPQDCTVKKWINFEFFEAQSSYGESGGSKSNKRSDGEENGISSYNSSNKSSRRIYVYPKNDIDLVSNSVHATAEVAAATTKAISWETVAVGRKLRTQMENAVKAGPRNSFVFGVGGFAVGFDLISLAAKGIRKNGIEIHLFIPDVADYSVLNCTLLTSKPFITYLQSPVESRQLMYPWLLRIDKPGSELSVLTSMQALWRLNAHTRPTHIFSTFYGGSGGGGGGNSSIGAYLEFLWDLAYKVRLIADVDGESSAMMANLNSFDGRNIGRNDEVYKAIFELDDVDLASIYLHAYQWERVI
ncbi:hypothetical protein HK100_012818 [Physocladia obscura]|uniref:Methyltransferase FkbM domain-containing protein n=1 Tax=Physocladia obscura TaxID=109957 RepID=A0AAD5T9P2_9FUNG|nr:hypothetical protein HK100_012818 [Physocladia obscura]